MSPERINQMKSWFILFKLTILRWVLFSGKPVDSSNSAKIPLELENISRIPSFCLRMKPLMDKDKKLCKKDMIWTSAEIYLPFKYTTRKETRKQKRVNSSRSESSQLISIAISRLPTSIYKIFESHHPLNKCLNLLTSCSLQISIYRTKGNVVFLTASDPVFHLKI